MEFQNLEINLNILKTHASIRSKLFGAYGRDV